MSSRVSTATRQNTTPDGIEPSTRRDRPGADRAALADTREQVVDRVSRSITLRAALAPYRRRGGGGSGRGSDDGPSRKGLLTDAELSQIERDHPDGLTAVQVVDIFVSRSIRFSEASFRKYVQQGLLPRSRRVGRKGKHRGSMGVYPSKTVRRVNRIKRLMGEGYTIEEIQAQFLRFTDVTESIEEGVTELFARLDEELQKPRFDKQTRRAIQREAAEARQVADDLLGRIDGLTRRVNQTRGDEYRNAGAAGSAEDLL